MAETARVKIILDDLLRIGEDAGVEIVAGGIVAMSPTGFLYNIVASNIYDVLRPFARDRGLGYAGMDNLLFILSQEGDAVGDGRSPDVSFIRAGSIPDFDFSRPFPGAPDLAIEVVSPTETGIDIQQKIDAYFRAGTEQIWVVYPENKKLHQHLRDDRKTIRVYESGDTLQAETLFPGLAIQVSDFFTLP